MLHDLLNASIDVWDTKTVKKCQNWGEFGHLARFLVDIGYKIYLFIIFSFHSDRTWIYGRFGVLHDLFYAFTSVKEPKNGKK